MRGPSPSGRSSERMAASGVAAIRVWLMRNKAAGVSGRPCHRGLGQPVPNGNLPCRPMLTSAASATTMQKTRNCGGRLGQRRLWRPCFGGGEGSLLPSYPGNRSTSPPASSLASAKARGAPGTPMISRASCSAASRLASDDSRPASSHGSRPSWVSAEIMLSGTPLFSAPTAANRKLSRSGRNGRKASRRVIVGTALKRGCPSLHRPDPARRSPIDLSRRRAVG